MLVLATAILLNNIQRRYQVFWISPVVPAAAQPSSAHGASEKSSLDSGPAAGKGHAASSASSDAESGFQMRSTSSV